MYLSMKFWMLVILINNNIVVQYQQNLSLNMHQSHIIVNVLILIV